MDIVEIDQLRREADAFDRDVFATPEIDRFCSSSDWILPAYAAWGRGLARGVGVALLASLPPLAAARRVPPIRVLRRQAEPLPPSRWALGGAVLALLAGLAHLKEGGCSGFLPANALRPVGAERRRLGQHANRC